MGDKPDGLLVEAALCGDVDSFTELCCRYYSTMTAIACAILGDRHLAEDAAQEAFAKACQSLKSLKDPNRFAGWLASICRNQAKDMARRLAKQASVEQRPDPPDCPQPMAEIDVDWVWEAIQKLPAPAKEVIYLRYYDELSARQMSAVLGISSEAINGRLRRARKTLAKYLQRDAGIRVQP